LMDTRDLYALTVTAAYPGIRYPVTVDVTPRRRQHFHPRPGEVLRVRDGGAAATEIRVESSGLFTIPRVLIRGSSGTRIRVERRP